MGWTYQVNHSADGFKYQYLTDQISEKELVNKLANQDINNFEVIKIIDQLNKLKFKLSKQRKMSEFYYENNRKRLDNAWISQNPYVGILYE